MWLLRKMCGCKDLSCLSSRRGWRFSHAGDGFSRLTTRYQTVILIGEYVTESSLIGWAVACCAPQDGFGIQPVTAVCAMAKSGDGLLGRIFMARPVLGRFSPTGSQKSEHLEGFSASYRSGWRDLLAPRQVVASNMRRPGNAGADWRRRELMMDLG